MKTEFYLFRHGQTDWNLQKRIQGHTDIPLNETGREQARKLVSLLAPYDLEIIYSSDLRRAFETGKTVADEYEIDLVTTKNLREANFGEAEGMLVEDAVKKFGEGLWEKFKNMDSANRNVRFPGGETRESSVLRMKSVLEEIIREGSYKRVGISTHGGVVRNLLHSFLPDEREIIAIPNCVVYRLAFHHLKKDWNVEGPLGHCE